MMRSNEDFTFEEMDEQMRQIEEALVSKTPRREHSENMELFRDLHRRYHEKPEDKRSVARVRERLLTVSSRVDQQSTQPIRKSLVAREDIGIKSEHLSSGLKSEPVLFSRLPFPVPDNKIVSRALTLVAFGMVVVLLAVNFISVLHLLQQSSGNPASDKMRSFPHTRDADVWPFAATSIWNMPIGSRAVYVPAKLAATKYTAYDAAYFVKTSLADRMRSLYVAGAWGAGRCTGTEYVGSIRIPDSLIVPDGTAYSTPINASAFLQPDGRTLVQVEPLARCEQGGNVYGFLACRNGQDQDIEGDGICGGHFGSGLSSIGGMIRVGELTGSQPIRHALQLELWMEKYGYYSQARPGYRWPAFVADNGAQQRYCSLEPCKSHANPSLVQGSLLALPTNVTPASLGITTEAGKKMFAALQDYGGYIVSNTGSDTFQIGVDNGVPDEYNQRFGLPFGEGVFHEDINKIFQALSVVDNNSSGAIGGGGTPRAPLAPPFVPQGKIAS